MLPFLSYSLLIYVKPSRLLVLLHFKGLIDTVFNETTSVFLFPTPKVNIKEVKMAIRPD